MIVENGMSVMNIGDFSFDLKDTAGFNFVRIMSEDIQKPDCPPWIISDWIVLKEFLKIGDAPLGDSDKDKINVAWQSYIARGQAPSQRLHSAFLNYKKVSVYVVRVFWTPRIKI